MTVGTEFLSLYGADATSVQIWPPVSQALRRLGGWKSLDSFNPCRTTNVANMVPIAANSHSLGINKQAWSWRNPDKTDKFALTRFLTPRHLR